MKALIAIFSFLVFEAIFAILSLVCSFPAIGCTIEVVGFINDRF